MESFHSNALMIVLSIYFDMNPHLQHHIIQKIVHEFCPSIFPDGVQTTKDSYPPGVDAGAHSFCTLVCNRLCHHKTTEMIKYSKDGFIFIVR